MNHGRQLGDVRLVYGEYHARLVGRGDEVGRHDLFVGKDPFAEDEAIDPIRLRVNDQLLDDAELLPIAASHAGADVDLVVSH